MEFQGRGRPLSEDPGIRRTGDVGNPGGSHPRRQLPDREVGQLPNGVGLQGRHRPDRGHPVYVGAQRRHRTLGLLRQLVRWRRHRRSAGGVRSESALGLRQSRHQFAGVGAGPQSQGSPLNRHRPGPDRRNPPRRRRGGPAAMDLGEPDPSAGSGPPEDRIRPGAGQAVAGGGRVRRRLLHNPYSQHSGSPG